MLFTPQVPGKRAQFSTTSSVSILPTGTGGNAVRMWNNGAADVTVMFGTAIDVVAADLGLFIKAGTDVIVNIPHGATHLIGIAHTSGTADVHIARGFVV